jgi:excisionase family DNA binding protein
MTVTTMHITGWPALLTLRQVQEELGIDREQIFHLATTRDFPLVKVGRTYRIPRKALVWWLAQEAGLAPEADDPMQEQELVGTARGHDV